MAYYRCEQNGLIFLGKSNETMSGNISQIVVNTAEIDESNFLIFSHELVDNLNAAKNVTWPTAAAGGSLSGSISKPSGGIFTYDKTTGDWSLTGSVATVKAACSTTPGPNVSGTVKLYNTIYLVLGKIFDTTDGSIASLSVDEEL